MTPEERAAVLAEELPTGRVTGFGPIPHRQWTAAEQARHRANLLAALDAHDADLRRAHLRLVPDHERALGESA